MLPKWVCEHELFVFEQQQTFIRDRVRTCNTMSKRKREETDDVPISGMKDRAVRIKVSRLKAKVDQGNRSITAALKLARGFERQKLGRRQKEAEKEPHTLLRLREEVIVLKQLDLAGTAEKYLFKQLAKTKRIKESPAFITRYGEDPKIEAPASTAEANVLARLFSSTPVKKVVPDIIKGIYRVLSIDPDGKASSAEIRTKTAKRDETSVRDGKGGDQVNQGNLQPEDDTFDGFSDADNPEMSVEDSGDFSGSENGLMEAYGGRIASGSEESLSDADSKAENNGRRSLDRETLSVSPPTSYISDSEVETQSQRRPRAAPPTDTTFLPSLTMGGYYSGSESDDTEPAYNQGPPLRQERKNRRGQRARQQIAEKKFGQSAKHLQKQAQNPIGKEERNTGWDARKGAVAESERGKGRFAKGRFGKSTGPTGANGEAVNGFKLRDRNSDAPVRSKIRSQAPATKKENNGPLHPSWQAAKKKKEATAANTAFQGKKITFD